MDGTSYRLITVNTCGAIYLEVQLSSSTHCGYDMHVHASQAGIKLNSRIYTGINDRISLRSYTQKLISKESVIYQIMT